MANNGHVHVYDENGKMICCSLEEKINIAVSQAGNESHMHNHDHDHSHSSPFIFAGISCFLLLGGLVLDHWLKPGFFDGWLRFSWYLLAYIPVAFPVLKDGFRLLIKGEVFTEFFLMGLATLGAFYIGEYPEGVAVMLFYTIGELFQAAAVKRSKNNIRALLDVRPKKASVLRNKQWKVISPEKIEVGEKIQIRAGEKVPLDGILLSEKASLNTAALTGESRPKTLRKGEKVLGGFINLEEVVQVQVTRLYSDSSIARILELVQNASSRKSKTELLIRRLAKIYTPTVTYLALAIVLVPYFFLDNYVFSDWFYRALIFLVISCPCALVISIPLGYFGGLGAASKNGLLFKGATFLDLFSRMNILVLDKTGTVTKGVFRIREIVPLNEWSEKQLMAGLLALESKSTHPVARAVMGYPFESPLPKVTDIQEIAGKGMKGQIDGKIWLAGNSKLMKQFDVRIPELARNLVDTIIFVAIEGIPAGYLTIADELKEDALSGIQQLKKEGVRQIMMLSGDKQTITRKVADELGIDLAYGDLMPEDKLYTVEKIQNNVKNVVAFVGDGINDAPVLAKSDIGIAMGALGSDVAIETADVVIQTDQLSKISTGIRIARSTQHIIWQNISLAFGVKAIVLILGALGMATMWAAVFADVGVALLAILNAVRLQYFEW